MQQHNKWSTKPTMPLFLPQLISSRDMQLVSQRAEKLTKIQRSMRVGFRSVCKRKETMLHQIQKMTIDQQNSCIYSNNIAFLLKNCIQFQAYLVIKVPSSITRDTVVTFTNLQLKIKSIIIKADQNIVETKMALKISLIHLTIGNSISHLWRFKYTPLNLCQLSIYFQRTLSQHWVLIISITFQSLQDKIFINQHLLTMKVI